MQVFVKASDGINIIILSNPDDTIDTLKGNIESKLGVPKDVQVLVYEGKQLADVQKSLKYYGIHTESQIHLVQV